MTESGGSTTVSESGAGDSIDIVLTASPASRVVIDVISADNGEVTVDVHQIIFSPANWNTPQTVPLTAVDDTRSDGTQVTQVTISVNSDESDASFGQLPARTVVVVSLDNEVATGGSLDIDADDEAKPLTDGILAIRFLAGFTGPTLVNKAANPEGSRSDPGEITTFLAAQESTVLDVDGNGDAFPLSDGLLIIRFLAGFTGNALVAGAVDTTGTRTTPAQITEFLNQYLPPAAVPAGAVSSSNVVPSSLSRQSTPVEINTQPRHNALQSDAHFGWLMPAHSKRTQIFNYVSAATADYFVYRVPVESAELNNLHQTSRKIPRLDSRISMHPIPDSMNFPWHY